jgi:hypothetical protein
MPVSTRRFTGPADSARWPYAVSCSAISCNFYVCAGSVEEADGILLKHETNGPCPFGAREASQFMPVGKSLQEMMWDKLDGVVDCAVDPETAPNVKLQKQGEISALSWCIFLMDQPYWKTVDAIQLEAAERLKMRKGEIPKRATPGCEVRHSVHELHERVQAEALAKRKAAPATKHPLDFKIEALDSKVLSRLIKGTRAGMDADFLAEVNNVELALVKRIAAQPDRFAPTGG